VLGDLLAHPQGERAENGPTRLQSALPCLAARVCRKKAVYLHQVARAAGQLLDGGRRG